MLVLKLANINIAQNDEENAIKNLEKAIKIDNGQNQAKK